MRIIPLAQWRLEGLGALSYERGIPVGGILDETEVAAWLHKARAFTKREPQKLNTTNQELAKSDSVHRVVWVSEDDLL